MKEKSSVLPIVLTIALVIGGGFFLMVRAGNKRRRELQNRLGTGDDKNNQQGGGVTTTTNTGGTTNTSPASTSTIINYDFSFPMKWGSKGESVKQLQLLLMQYDNRILNPFGADGKFGSVTESAIKKIIGKNKIESQQDIAAIQQKIREKAQSLTKQVGLNIALGLPLNSTFLTK